MEQKTYLEKLKDPRWQKKRLEILERDEWTCQYCESKEKTLHVHHLRYFNADPWDCDPVYLITTCADCHEYESVVREEWEGFLINSLRTIGLSSQDIFDFHYLLENGFQGEFTLSQKKILRANLKTFIHTLDQRDL